MPALRAPVDHPPRPANKSIAVGMGINQRRVHRHNDYWQKDKVMELGRMGMDDWTLLEFSSVADDLLDVGFVET